MRINVSVLNKKVCPTGLLGVRLWDSELLCMIELCLSKMDIHESK